MLDTRCSLWRKMQDFHHITEHSCSAPGRSKELTCSEQSKCWTHWAQGESSVEDKQTHPQAQVLFHHSRMGRKAKPLRLPRSSDILEGGWEHQGEGGNWISVYFGPRLRSVHNEEVIRWLIWSQASCWDKVRTVPTGEMWACQIARVQAYIIHFYSWSHFLDQIWGGKEHSFVVAWGVGNLGFIHLNCQENSMLTYITCTF